MNVVSTGFMTTRENKSAPWAYFSILNICDQSATEYCVDQEINKGGAITCLHMGFQKTTPRGTEISIENETLKLPQRAILAYSKLLCFSKQLFSWQSQPLP